MADIDALLLRRFCDTADPEAFSEIVRLYAGVVYGACRRIVRDSDLAADVAQETFFQLLRNAGDVSGSLAGWLHTVATRKAIDSVRKDSARKARELEFSSGTVRCYKAPRYIYDEMRRSKEMGRFFNEKILDKYKQCRPRRTRGKM